MTAFLKYWLQESYFFNEKLGKMTSYDSDIGCTVHYLPCEEIFSQTLNIADIQ